MKNLKKYLEKDLILVILVNFFIANLLPHGIYLGCMFAIIAMYGENPICSFVGLVGMLFLPLMRLISLPVLYSQLEKKSKNVYIKKFINNLKCNNFFRIRLLFLAAISPMISIIYFILSNRNEYIYEPFKIIIECFIFEIALILLFDIFGSYLILFLYWDIQKLIKKIKNKTAE